jgi:maltose alpha-D-glucosyltransferase / alpha-amylase
LDPRDLWYKRGVIYCVDVETFVDSNGDGVGDFAGLTSKLDYIAGLGVTCIWLLPFYPSPNRDNGYDITDYYGVDPRLGTLGDFVEFEYHARERGIRVVVDLVINHTSDEHPWFKAAGDPRSPYHHYYVWREERPEDHADGVVFPGVQDTIWSWDRRAQKYYLHRFYEHQPDLNIANPDVLEEIRKIMGFWLELGVSGFRVDALPFVIDGTNTGPEADPHEYLLQFRQFLSWRRGDAILLAEANIEMEKVPEYFGDGSRLQMLFHFMLNQHFFLAVARESAEPLKKGLQMPPAIPNVAQWATFLRNHDELDLGRLPDNERSEIFEALAPDPETHLYDRGVRRRLAPMLGGDKRRIQMAFSLLYTLPGTPVIWYGDEIGMGDLLELPERLPVRTPMQWNAGPNAGFSGAKEEELIHPVVDDGDFAYSEVNVEVQRQDPESLLNWNERAIRARKESPEFGWGAWEIVDSGDEAVFVHRVKGDHRDLVAVHNLSSKPRTVKLKLAGDGKCFDIFGDRDYAQSSANGNGTLKLSAFGYRWLEVVPRDGDASSARTRRGEGKRPAKAQ